MRNDIRNTDGTTAAQNTEKKIHIQCVAEHTDIKNNIKLKILPN